MRWGIDIRIPVIVPLGTFHGINEPFQFLDLRKCDRLDSPELLIHLGSKLGDILAKHLLILEDLSYLRLNQNRT